MVLVPVSDALKELLVRQGLLGEPVGAEPLNVMEWANALIDREERIDADHSPAGGTGRPMGLRLVFSNTQSIRRDGRALCLVLIEGGIKG